MTGFFTVQLSLIQRAAYIVGGLALLLPSQAFANAYLVEIAGGIICGAVFALERMNKQK